MIIKKNNFLISEEFQLVKKNNIKISERPLITSSYDSYKILMASWNMGCISFTESFKVILLNKANRVLGIKEISSGGMTACIADPKIIFMTALASGACGIVLAHNHPSGNLNPSKADLDITEKLKNGGQLLDIAVLDHIIVTHVNFYSFADEGLM